MTARTLSEFSERVNEMMPVITREFLRHQTSEFFRVRLTMPQFIVLDILHRRDESKMTDLANFMHVTTAAVTGVVDKLVKSGYVKRANDPKDRRIIRVSLTAKGDSVIEKILDHRKKIMMRIFSMISEDEREAYIRILEHIKNQLVNKKGSTG
jgi:DNA-binding MarR family transcriptional regulator